MHRERSLRAVKQALATWMLLGTFAAAACGQIDTPPPVGEGATGALAAGKVADARSTAIVGAADAFLATLDDEQRKAAVFAFGDGAQRTRWSNFPVTFVPRSGLAWGELDADQKAALLKLLGTVLSPKGVEMVRAQMAADEVLAQQNAANFGENRYFVAFLGAPAPDRAWTLQFGGHHLAINATIAGPDVTLSPTLTGGEPLRFTQDGKPVELAADEARVAQELLSALNPDQRARAIVSATRIDPVLGPGQDGNRPAAEGLPASAMTPSQKRLLVALIGARLEILNEDDFGPLMAGIEATLDQTSFGWWGPVSPPGTGYFRIVGPRILLEFSPQDMDGDPSNHAHNMFRDPANDYGAAWTTLD